MAAGLGPCRHGPDPTRMAWLHKLHQLSSAISHDVAIASCTELEGQPYKSRGKWGYVR
jgi:hypothetical protein